MLTRLRLVLALATLLPVLAGCGGAPAAAPQAQATALPTGDLSGAQAPTQNQNSRMPAPTAAAAATAAPAAEAMVGVAVPAPAAPEVVSSQDAAQPTIAPEPVEVNPYTRTSDDNLSTFALDVDTASFSAARTYLDQGMLPPPGLVRVEEFVNYFRYAYPNPDDTFGITIDGAPSPFGKPGSQIVRVGIQGRRIDPAQRQDAALTFVIDVSGSMADANRLPLVKRALRLLVNELRSGDTVAIVVYGNEARTVLNPTSADQRETILTAIDGLENEGATNAEAGLQMGYKLAADTFRRGASNRVILLSDGVANVGETGPKAILRTIRDQAAQGIFLTTVGFGMGDYNDVLMEQLANDGNGAYAYVDNENEARRIFVENLTGTLQVIAKDAKVQVVFNPAVVAQYRLLGYENRAVADADFRNDKVDAGEIGAGHSVTALYELELTGQGSGEALTVQLRWAEPEGGAVHEISRAFTDAQFGTDFTASAADFQLAVAAAAFAEQLRGSAYAMDWTLSEVRTIAERVATALANDPDAQELLRLIRQAESLAG